MPSLGPRTIGTLALLAGVLALLGIERAWPLRRATRRLRERLAANVGLSALGSAVGALVAAPAALLAARWAETHRVGLVHWAGLPPLAAGAAGFLLLDLTYYHWHRANHLLGPLWRFHRVHHADPDLDVTTAFRFHPGEVLYSVAFRVAQVAVIGVTPALFAVYEIAFRAATAFHHGNVRLPLLLERAVNRVVVTPRMHGIHHSSIPAENRCNCSVIFSWWDLLHRTLLLNVPQADVDIGLAAPRAPRDLTLARVLLLPFRTVARASVPSRGREAAPPTTMLE